MEVLKKILLVIYMVVCVALILITTFQTKDNANSLEDTYENPRANKYFEKNKSRTKAGRVQKRTIIASTIFAVLTIVTAIVYVL